MGWFKVRKLLSSKTKRLLLSFLSLFSLLFNSFSPFMAVAYAQEASPTSEPVAQQTTETTQASLEATIVPSVETSPEVSPEISPTPTLTDTPTVEPTVVPAPAATGSLETITLGETPTAEPSAELSPTPAPAVEKECLADQVILDSLNEDWNIDLEKGISETKEKVTLGVKYVFPQENKVTLTFKCLPKDVSLRTSLKIEKVKISDLDLPEGTNPYGEYAYDITTGMKNGDFEYEVTLPKPEGQEAQVSYMEDVNAEVQSVDERNINEEGDKVKVGGLDHFTVYFVESYSSGSYIDVKNSYYRGETVYAKGTSDDYKTLRLVFKNPSNSIVKTCSQVDGYQTTCEYPLPLDAPTGEWDIELQRHSGGSWSTKDTDHFNVLTSKPDLVVSKTNNVGGSTSLNQPFNWTLTITNSGSASATFNNQTILVDDLSSGATYSVYSVSNEGGTTGLVNCNINDSYGGKSLSCVDNNGGSSVVIPTGGSIVVVLATTPTSIGSLSNPRTGGWSQCKVDPTDWWGNDSVDESNEGNNTCSDTVAVTQYITPNPTLSSSCGLDVALVLDNSGSVGSNLTTMKNAFKSFVDSLAGTPTQFSVTYFNETAHIQQVFSGDPATVKSAIDNVPYAGGSTNWQDGLLKAKLTYDPRPSVPNLVIFSSDGDPNKYYTNISDEGNPTGLTGPGNGSDTASHNAAISLSNTIKGSGTRVITLGIGGGSSMQSRMVAISSADAYYNAGNFDELSTALNEIVTDLCGGTISVTKLVDGQAASGWDYSVSVTGGTPTPSSGTTDGSGKVNFDINPTDGSTTASVIETVKSGYQIVSASCSTATHGVGTFDGVDSVDGITVGSSDVISCTFNNRQLPTTGTITIVKDSQPDSSQSFHFTYGYNTYPIGDFSLVDDGGDGSETVTYSSIPAGAYSWTEDAVSGWSLHNITCDDVNSGVSATNARTVDVNLEGGEHVICKFTNTKDVGSIWGAKFNDLNGDGQREGVGGSEPGLEGWTIRLLDASGVQINTVLTDSRGEYEFLNLPVGTYRVCEVLQSGWTAVTPECQDVVVTTGQASETNFGNFELGSADGCKYNDLNGNGVREREVEPQLGGWKIRLYNSDWVLEAETQTVSSDLIYGYNYRFDHVMGNGTYYLCEVMQPGWIQTEPGAGFIVNQSANAQYEGGYCRQVDNNYSGSDWYGQRFGNMETLLGLTLAKSNTVSGSTVTYSLEVENTSNQDLSVTVYDSPPGGFSYVSGSSQYDGSSIGDPTNNSGLLSWTVFLGKGEKKTLSYQAIISGELKDGVYTNQAYAKGVFALLDREYKVTYSRSVETGLVSSEVSIIKGLSYGGTLSFTTSVLGASTGQVLGASTELPGTGNPTMILLIAGLSGILGLSLRRLSKKYEKN